MSNNAQNHLINLEKRKKKRQLTNIGIPDPVPDERPNNSPMELTGSRPFMIKTLRSESCLRFDVICRNLIEKIENIVR